MLSSCKDYLVKSSCEVRLSTSLMIESLGKVNFSKFENDNLIEEMIKGLYRFKVYIF